MVRRVVPPLVALLVVSAAAASPPLRQGTTYSGHALGHEPIAAGAVRAPDARTDMDTNPANLASAVLTHAFGLLPEYIDGAGFRLLPFDPYRASVRGQRTTRVYKVRTPRTSLVLDTVVTSALTEAEARRDAAQYSVDVTLDGRYVPHPERYWIFYRNNGPQICRIYFPGDLGSLNMAAHSLVLRPPTPGEHELDVVVHQRIVGGPGASLVTAYLLTVLPRGPNARERASAPSDSADPRSLGNTPLTFRTPKG